jgi:hypothetical protein
VAANREVLNEKDPSIAEEPFSGCSPYRQTFINRIINIKFLEPFFAIIKSSIIMNVKLFKNKIMAIVAIFTIVLGVGVALASTHKTHHNKAAFTSLYWYPVDPSTNETTGPAEYHDTKSDVVANPGQPCKDDASQPICLFGSAISNLATGTNVGSPAPADRILETTP